MRSSEILASWDDAKPVFFGRFAHWISLHRINASGQDGTNLNELAKLGGAPSAVTLEAWADAGIVERREIVREKLPRLVRYVATAKARRLLRVEAEKPMEAVRLEGVAAFGKQLVLGGVIIAQTQSEEHAEELARGIAALVKQLAKKEARA